MESDVKVCAYGKFTPYAANCTHVATRNRGGYDLCETCYTALVTASIKYDLEQEMFYAMNWKTK